MPDAEDGGFAEEIFKAPFNPVNTSWYLNHEGTEDLQPLANYDLSNNTSGDELVGRLRYARLEGCLASQTGTAGEVASTASVTESTCVLHLHGFPDQAVDHREEAVYGQFGTRMAKKFAECLVSATQSFGAFNFTGTPGSQGIPGRVDLMKFFEKTVSQEVWDVLNVMGFLSRTALERNRTRIRGFHITGLSTGAIIGAVLRAASPSLCSKLGIPPILSISILASCGVDVNAAFAYDFDEEQRAAFDEHGECWKQFWLPLGSKWNPAEAELVPQESKDEAPAEGGAAALLAEPPAAETPAADVKWVPHRMKLGAQYRADFLRLPVKEHVERGTIPLLVIHGAEDKSVPVEEGRKLFEAAGEPKQYLELPKANHMFTNSKDLKKVIAEIQKWQQKWNGD